MEKAKILMDGALGTLLWQEAEKAGLEKTPVWMYNQTAPELVKSIHLRYLEAGSDLILTNTFTVNAMEMKKYEGQEVASVIEKAVQIAREAASEAVLKGFKAADDKILVGLDIGPLPGVLEPYGDIEEDEADEVYKEVMDAGVKAGVDCIVLETFYDLGVMEAAAKRAKTYGLPLLCSMTFEKNGRTFMGASPEDVAASLTEIGADAMGLNCSVGPKDALPVIKRFSELTDKPLIFKPNSMSEPEPGELKMPYTREMYVEDLKAALPYVTYVGCCCGTDESYIRAISKALASPLGEAVR